MKILVIDDEYASLNTFLYNVIDRYELDIKMFMNDPAAAVRYAAENPVDGAFIDIRMPSVDGVTLAARLTEVCPGLPVVFITGYAYNKELLTKKFGKNLLGFCEKPFDPEKIADMLEKMKPSAKHGLYIRTFGAFDLFSDGVPVRFPSAKSKELLALLTDREGATVTMGETLCALWPESPPDKAKILYRDAVWKLRKALRACGAEHLVTFARAALFINRVCPCDLWGFESGRAAEYSGEYMTLYDWSLERQEELLVKKEKLQAAAEKAGRPL